MFCPNCGKKVDEKAVICVGCGVPLNNNFNNQVANNNQKKGKGIASLVLGIIAFIYSLSAFAAFDKLDDTIYPYQGSQQIAFAVGFVLVQFIFAIISFCLAYTDKKNNKNGFNISGFWLSIISFAMIAIQFIYVVTY